MKKILFSTSELTELENLEILGGYDPQDLTQNGCTNNGCTYNACTHGTCNNGNCTQGNCTIQANCSTQSTFCQIAGKPCSVG